MYIIVSYLERLKCDKESEWHVCDGSTVLLMKLLVGLGHIITLAQICEDGKADLLAHSLEQESLFAC